MAKELSVGSVLKVTNGKLIYTSQPNQFVADQAVCNGPSPGAVTASHSGTGTNISLAQLAVPAMTRIMNLDPTNYVTIGLVVSSVFYPLAEVLPGESYVLRLSRTVLAAATIHALAHTADCNILFECFDQ